MEMLKAYVPMIYTDGSCLKNPGGPGGWAFCILENSTEKYSSGADASTTNNRMELQAVIEALKFAKSSEYMIYTDSQLVMNCATGKWNRKANLDLWEQYDRLKTRYKLHWTWVKSHNGDKYNSMVDELARKEAKSIKNKNLFQ
jgi:ribonuclease HI